VGLILRLILIKHSLPEIVENVPARDWHLSDEGRRRCSLLADLVARYQPDVLITSLEPKAQETGQLLAESLQIPVSAAADLHEHERYNTPFLSPEMFKASVSALFENPGQRVMGEESADEAHARFANAVRGVVGAHAHQNIAIVAHGTVISLFAAHLAGMNPYLLWEQLGLPAIVVLSLPGYQFINMENITL
jgi:broad specificity phosphatase PhoE